VWGYVRNWQNVVANNNPLKYCGSLGHRSEGNTGLIYMRARYYDPATGRFESEDSAKDGANWSLYADGNPVTNCDANGRETLADVSMSTAMAASLGALQGGIWTLLNDIAQVQSGNSNMSALQILMDTGVGAAAGGGGALGPGAAVAAAGAGSFIQNMIHGKDPGSSFRRAIGSMMLAGCGVYLIDRYMDQSATANMAWGQVTTIVDILSGI